MGHHLPTIIGPNHSYRTSIGHCIFDFRIFMRAAFGKYDVKSAPYRHCLPQQHRRPVLLSRTGFRPSIGLFPQHNATLGPCPTVANPVADNGKSQALKASCADPRARSKPLKWHPCWGSRGDTVSQSRSASTLGSLADARCSIATKLPPPFAANAMYSPPPRLGQSPPLSPGRTIGNVRLPIPSGPESKAPTHPRGAARTRPPMPIYRVSTPSN
jgi:hypothetical protein